MKQLDLTKDELKNIGFKRVISEPDKENFPRIYWCIDTVNGCFYYNPTEEIYKWYHRTDIGEVSNHKHLNITQKPVLFSILQAFQVDFKIVM